MSKASISDIATNPQAMTPLSAQIAAEFADHPQTDGPRLAAYIAAKITQPGYDIILLERTAKNMGIDLARFQTKRAESKPTYAQLKFGTQRWAVLSVMKPGQWYSAKEIAEIATEKTSHKFEAIDASAVLSALYMRNHVEKVAELHQGHRRNLYIKTEAAA